MQKYLFIRKISTPLKRELNKIHSRISFLKLSRRTLELIHFFSLKRHRNNTDKRREKRKKEKKYRAANRSATIKKIALGRVSIWSKANISPLIIVRSFDGSCHRRSNKYTYTRRDGSWPGYRDLERVPKYTQRVVAIL